MDDIVIYPADWYFNACVHGFLEVLEYGLGEETVQSFLKDDGTIRIPRDIAEAVFSTKDKLFPASCSCACEVPDELGDVKRIVWWWAKKTVNSIGKQSESVRRPKDFAEFMKPIWGKLFHFNAGFYPNLLQRKWNERDFLNKWFSVENQSGDLVCAFCGKRFEVDKSSRIYDAYFTRSVSPGLGSTPEEVPNFFWNGRPSLPMCRVCRSYLLCFHIVRNNGFFLNTGSLKANWHINRLLTGNRYNSEININNYYNLLGVVGANHKLRKLISGWTLAGFEFISMAQKKIECHYLSSTVAQWLMNPRISSFLRFFRSSDHEMIWKLLLAENINYFPVISYKSLRTLLTGKNQAQDKEVVLKNDKEIHGLLSLYYELNFELKRQGGENMREINLGVLHKEGKNGPLNIDDNSKKNLVFRILELTRLGRKEDVYHMLLRTYIASGQKFPNQLARVFEEDISVFKTAIFAYLAGVASDSSGSQMSENNVKEMEGDISERTEE